MYLGEQFDLSRDSLFHFWWDILKVFDVWNVDYGDMRIMDDYNTSFTRNKTLIAVFIQDGCYGTN